LAAFGRVLAGFWQGLAGFWQDGISASGSTCYVSFSTFLASFFGGIFFFPGQDLQEEQDFRI
jgi:hypothetical protein